MYDAIIGLKIYEKNSFFFTLIERYFQIIYMSTTNTEQACKTQFLLLYLIEYSGCPKQIKIAWIC